MFKNNVVDYLGYRKHYIRSKVIKVYYLKKQRFFEVVQLHGLQMPFYLGHKHIYFLYTTVIPLQITEVAQLQKFYKIFKVLDLESNIYFQARETTKTH